MKKAANYFGDPEKGDAALWERFWRVHLQYGSFKNWLRGIVSK